ncbi:MAG: hypothetical protein PHF50_01890 [Patescibacteria group bacterium]|nr:hypothetical protein [Patescibacteria group bacterium]
MTERCGVHVDGIIITGYSTLKEAEDAIRLKPEWQKKGAGATELSGVVKKRTFTEEFPFLLREK